MKKTKILLVDDEDLIRASLAIDLDESGYEVVAAAGGMEALLEFRAGNFDLVITDLLMEEMDGLALLSELRAEAPEIGVIILTAFGDLPTAIEAIRLGADDYLLKPYKFEELQTRVNICLQKRALKKRIKVYENFLPICAVCRKIRDDEGREPGSGPWLHMEEFLAQKAGLRPSHTYCPHCFAAASRDIG
ncbi:response regulator [Desulfurivibrio sp. C05AmB]|jgi:DNA-binding response OmpR family regulator|uniref:response regulator n=1 Tax=Desulfurivibrio sp. C05AmB TaxID=3374371 RepID=UPI00376EF4C0